MTGGGYLHGYCRLSTNLVRLYCCFKFFLSSFRTIVESRWFNGFSLLLQVRIAFAWCQQVVENLCAMNYQHLWSLDWFSWCPLWLVSSMHLVVNFCSYKFSLLTPVCIFLRFFHQNTRRMCEDWTTKGRGPYYLVKDPVVSTLAQYISGFR